MCLFYVKNKYYNAWPPAENFIKGGKPRKTPSPFPSWKKGSHKEKKAPRNRKRQYGEKGPHKEKKDSNTWKFSLDFPEGRASTLPPPLAAPM